LTNAGLDGIDHIGERVASEISAKVNECKATKLSLVGHSNGGLVARFALASLEGVCGLETESFVTFSSPHLGARRLGSGSIFDHTALDGLAQIIGTSPLFGKSGQQLMLMDGCSTVDPLLLRMSKEDRFLQGLAQFRQRIAVSNISNEILVPFCSSALVPPQTPIPCATLRTNEFAHIVSHTPPVNSPLTAALDETSFLEATPLASMMLSKLSPLGWHRVSADFPTGVLGLSHWWIVGKHMPSIRLGSVVEYVAHLLTRPPVEDIRRR
jgi:hypothetical protein